MFKYNIYINIYINLGPNKCVYIYMRVWMDR